MASIRRLKKDINYLTDEIVQHGLLINMLYQDVEDKVKDILETALEDRKELMQRVCAKQQTKGVYKQIRKDLILKVDSSFEKLAELAK